MELFIAHNSYVFKDTQTGHKHEERDGRVATNLDGMEVNVSEHIEAVNLNALKKVNHLLDRLQPENLFLVSNQKRNTEVEDKVFVSLEKEDLPEFIQ